MKLKGIIIFLLLFLPVYLNSRGLSKARIFGIAGFGFSLISIGADIGVEYYYNKYEEAILRDECTKYRNFTVFCEKTRDISFGLAVVNFSISTIFLLKEKKPEIELGINCKKGKLCVGLAKFLY